MDRDWRNNGEIMEKQWRSKGKGGEKNIMFLHL